jgi:Ca2+-transporting ATPase
MEPEEVFKSLGTSKDGLTTKKAEELLEKFGANELDEEEEESLWEKIKEQFEDLLARILLLAAFISFVIAITGDGEEGIAAYVEPFVILVILILNAMVAIYQDKDAESAMEALKNMQAVDADVFRDGKLVQLEATQLVPGDVVQVKMGNSIPADIRLIHMTSIAFSADESSLTGEPIAVQKSLDVADKNAEDIIQSQGNMIFSATTVSYGQATGVVVFTGMNTAIGRV